MSWRGIPSPTNVIVGMRPEHFDDAALVDAYARIRALTFEVTVELVESLGADKYLHFTTEGAGAKRPSWRNWPPNRVSVKTSSWQGFPPIRRRRRARRSQLAFDTTKMTIFDADSGKNLTLPDTVADDVPAPDEPSAAPDEPPAAPSEPTTPTSDAPAPDEPTSEAQQSSSEPSAPPSE